MFCFQSPMPPAPVVYSHPSEYLYQSANGGSVQPPLAVREDTTAEVQTHKGMNVSFSLWVSCKLVLNWSSRRSVAAHGAAGLPPLSSENWSSDAHCSPAQPREGKKVTQLLFSLLQTFRVSMSHLSPQNQLFPLSHAHLKPKFHPYINHKDHHYLLEAAERPDASMLHASQPLM